MKKLFCFLLAAFCLLSFAPAAHAEHFDGREGWNVTYTTEGKLESNFHTPDYNDPVAGLQVFGDDQRERSAVHDDLPDIGDVIFRRKVRDRPDELSDDTDLMHLSHRIFRYAFSPH